MADLFSIPTLLICTSSVTFVVALALTLAWFRDHRSDALGLWCLALWVGTLASLVLALRLIAPFWLAIGIGNMLGASAYALMWLGSRVFDGRRPHWALGLAGPAVWIIAFALVPAVHDNVNGRIVLMSILIGIYAFATSVEVYRGGRQEPLPTRPLAVFAFATHAVVYLSRIPLIYYSPPEYRHGSGYSTWYALITFELFLHTMFAAVMIIALIKERAEARYRDASERDPLTDILNRRAFAARVDKLVAARPDGVLMLLDIDHFKLVNDGHGHLVGDSILVSFARAVSDFVGDRAIFGRLGGEEFALYFRGVSGRRGLDLADTLRLSIGQRSVIHLGDEVRVTVSIGVADASDVSSGFDALFGAADLALYDAKRTGRDRVVGYDPVRHLRSIHERIGGASRTPQGTGTLTGRL